MKLIWTYNSKVKFDSIVGIHTSAHQTILINFYIHSIKIANSFGYDTIIYCDIDSVKYFKDIANEVITLTEIIPSLLWDSFKIQVLEIRNDNFTLIDGDVILHSKLPIYSSDVIFDSFETTAFNYKYKQILTDLTDMGIGDKMDIWVNKKLPIFSCGILTINNIELKNKYVFNWKIYNEFINSHANNLNIDLATMVGAQYLLSILSEKYTYTNLSNFVGGENPYYKHYCGPLKYNNPIVPSNYIINHLKKQLL